MNEKYLIIKQGDDFCEDILAKGYVVKKAYKGDSTLSIVMRNIWNRWGLPLKKIWYKSDLRSIEQSAIVVFDAMIKEDFLIWLRKIHPNKRIILVYLNVVKTTPLNPDNLRDVAELYTWDRKDAREYGLKMYKGIYWPQIAKVYEKKYDVVFIGVDKGRLKDLLILEKCLNSYGIKTYFHIVGDHIYRKTNMLGYKYKKKISYEHLLKITLKSRAIIEIVQEGQVGTTFRTMESIFYGIKLISNNKELKKYDFYDSNNIFILGVDSMDGIYDFIYSEYRPIDEGVLKTYTFDYMIQNL